MKDTSGPGAAAPGPFVVPAEITPLTGPVAEAGAAPGQ